MDRRTEVPHVETRWEEVGLRITDVRPLEELPQLVDRIRSDGGKLVAVSLYPPVRQLLAVLVCLVSLAGCASIRTVPITVPFDTAAVAHGKDAGTASIEGQAFLKTQGGDVKYAAGDSVILLPASAYTEAYLAQELKGFRWARSPVLVDPRLAQYTRRTIADGEGKFAFRSIAPGDYFVYAGIFWQYPSQYGAQTTGAWVKKRVTAKSGESMSVMLTQ